MVATTYTRFGSRFALPLVLQVSLESWKWQTLSQQWLNLITDQYVITDQKDQILKKNKRPLSNKGDQVGQILKNK